MPTCAYCGKELVEGSRFCTQCGKAVTGEARPAWTTAARKPPEDRDAEEMNIPVLYAMAAALILAALYPPWEAPPGRPPEFLGFHFILSPPSTGDEGGQGAGVISRLLITIELVTIAVAGLYFSWLFRKKS